MRRRADHRSLWCIRGSAALLLPSRWTPYDGPDLVEDARPCLPPSSNWVFHAATEAPDVLFRRAASATVISPARTDNTIRSLSSPENCGGRLTVRLLHGSGVPTNTCATKSDARHGVL